jgi:hypothetical protein
MRDLINRIETLWCEQMHSTVMWPIHGKYRCGSCMREYTVPFATAEPSGLRAVPARQAVPARIAA